MKHFYLAIIMKHTYLVILVAALFLSGCGTPAAPTASGTLSQDLIEAAYTSAAQTVQADAPVSSSTPAAPAPSATFAFVTSTPLWIAPPTFTIVPVTPVCRDRAQFVGESGLNQRMYKPGEKFNKTWMLKNIGECTWDQYYDLVFANQGVQLGASGSVAFIPAGRMVQPGDSVNISMSFAAPAAPGIYQSLWNLVDGYGSSLPIQGGFTDSALYTEIEVSDQTGEAAAGWITGVYFDNLQVVEGTQCGADASYVLDFSVAANGPVTTSAHFSTYADSSIENGLISLADDTFVFTEASVQGYSLTIWGPYEDPAHVTVKVVLDGQPVASYTIPCP